jgi:hypothetical protein
MNWEQIPFAEQLAVLSISPFKKKGRFKFFFSVERMAREK